MSQRRILGVLILTFVISVIWTVSNFYDKYTQTTISPLLQTQIAPITPAFDRQTLESLKKRTAVVPLYTPQQGEATQSTSSQSSSLTPAVVATPISPIPSAVPSIPAIQISPAAIPFFPSSQGGALLP